MDQFEFVVSLLSVVVGLGITHILSTMGDAVHTYTHFVENRSWLFGTLLAATLLDFFDTLIKGADWACGSNTSQTGVFIFVCVTGWLSQRRVMQIVLASIAFLSQLLYNWNALNVLGAW